MIFIIKSRVIEYGTYTKFENLLPIFWLLGGFCNIKKNYAFQTKHEESEKLWQSDSYAEEIEI